MLEAGFTRLFVVIERIVGEPEIKRAYRNSYQERQNRRRELDWQLKQARTA